MEYLYFCFEKMTLKYIDYLFPRQCIHCLLPGAYLCKNCKKKLEPHPEICPYCHRYSKDYLTCIECKTNKNNHLEGIIIPFAYTTLLKKLIIKLKYFHKKDIGDFLVDRLILAFQANESLQKKIHNVQISTFKPQLFISYIPSHWFRHYFIKWYNQSAILAKKLSQKTKIPLFTIANKRRYTKSQASLDRNGRINNLKNTFFLYKNLPLTGNEIVIIVDDITTTGSTINQLAHSIKEKYPHIKVRWAVLGRHR